MVDLEVKPVPDIDSCYYKNPLAIVDYVDDIYIFYRQLRQAEVNIFWIRYSWLTYCYQVLSVSTLLMG